MLDRVKSYRNVIWYFSWSLAWCDQNLRSKPLASFFLAYKSHSGPVRTSKVRDLVRSSGLLNNGDTAPPLSFPLNAHVNKTPPSYLAHPGGSGAFCPGGPTTTVTPSRKRARAAALLAEIPITWVSQPRGRIMRKGNSSTSQLPTCNNVSQN